MRLTTYLSILAFTLSASIQTYAMDATGVFKKSSPSVFVVVSSDSTGQVKAQGSGIHIGKGRVITNCHVIDDAATVVLIQQDKKVSASLKSRDKERDLCVLATSQPLVAPIAAISASSSLEQGQPVFAIGAPMGLELTISDGIVSGLRKAVGGFIVQTSAAISPGSSGGGLFDSDGRLVGVTTFQYVKGQNLNFAVPAEWIAQVEVRESLEADLRDRREGYEKEVGAYDINNPADHQKIIQLSRKYLQADPDHILALFNLAYALDKSGQQQAAEAVWLKLVDLPVKSHLDSMNIGLGAMYLSIYYDKTGREVQARDAAAKGVVSLPIEILLGNYWGFLKAPDDYKSAINIFKTAISVTPGNPYAWAYLGGSYMNTKDYENALRSFRKATQLKPDYEWAWFGYLVTLRSSGGDDEMKSVVRFLYDNQRDMLNNILKSFKKN